MKDRERLLRLHKRLDEIEADLARLTRQIALSKDPAETADLKHRHNLAQAKANALQILFDADFLPSRPSAG